MVHHYKPQRGRTYAMRLPQNEITNEMEFQTKTVVTLFLKLFHLAIAPLVISRAGLLDLGTIGIWGWITFCGGAALGTAGHRGPSLDLCLYPWLPGVHPSHDNPKCLQTLSSTPWGSV